jgi:hypothetical protein
MPELLWCVETLEAYELTGDLQAPYDLYDQAEYPASGSVTFDGIQIGTTIPIAPGGWVVQSIVSTYGEHTTIVNNDATNGEIRISF